LHSLVDEIKGTLLADPDRVRVIAQIDPEDPRMETRRLVLNKNKGKSKAKPRPTPGSPTKMSLVLRHHPIRQLT